MDISKIFNTHRNETEEVGNADINTPKEIFQTKSTSELDQAI